MRKSLLVVIFSLGLVLGVALSALFVRCVVSPGGEQVAVETVGPASAPAGPAEEARTDDEETAEGVESGVDALVAKETLLEERIAELNRQRLEYHKEIQQLRDERERLLAERRMAEEETEAPPDEETERLTSYRKELVEKGYNSFTENLLLTPEAKIALGLTDRQVTAMNNLIQENLREYRKFESANAYLEYKDENMRIYRISPLAEGEAMGQKISQELRTILGEELAKSFQDESKHQLMRAFGCFGTAERTVTIYTDPADEKQCYHFEDVLEFTGPGRSGSISGWWVFYEPRMPPGFDHIVTEEEIKNLWERAY